MPFHARRNVSFDNKLMLSCLLKRGIHFKVTDSAVSQLTGDYDVVPSGTVTMSEPSSYSIFPLGDSALTVDFGNIIDETVNNRVLALYEDLRRLPPEGMIEAFPAYSSISIYFDVFLLAKKKAAGQTAFDFLAGQLEQRLAGPPTSAALPGKLLEVPVCYQEEYAPDLRNLAASKGLTADEVIAIHTSTPYRVFMLGFLPGFGYMGEIDERISMNRKHQPGPVVAGSIGIAGRQTGIYPLDSPGGWHIIGRTPLRIFDADADHSESKAGRDGCFSFLHAGDRVQFISITKDEFENY